MTQSMLDAFCSYLTMERGLVENTVRSYVLDLDLFARWFKQPIERADRAHVQKFLVHRLASGSSPQTVTRELFALRRLYNFLLDEETITKDPTLGIPLPKRAKKVQHAATLAEVEAMLASLASLGSTPLELRDRAELLLMFGSGLRASELLNLKLTDVKPEQGFVQVWCGKGSKDGVVPLNPLTITAIREYLGKGRAEFDPKGECPYLFIGVGNRNHGRQFTRQNLHNRIREISMRVLGKELSPHRFRAGCATALLEGGSDLIDTQRIMRHASVDSTQRYLDVSMAFARKAYQTSHPRAQGEQS
jgi:integrase/recombinase XerD